ncbi:PAS domain-containing protein [Pyruvatibacter sp.]|uniref:PAS domain-containing protein n=1 Tax=Pyruvatibacter sp. TaxID=1981328 RepID=UPI0032EB972D
MSEPLIRHADIRLALTTWMKVRGNALYPTVHEFGPFEMKPYLPHVSIFRRTPEGGHKVTLLGTGLVEAYGFDATGMDVADIYPPEELAELHPFYDLIFPDHYLSHSLRTYKRKTGAHMTLEQILMPLGNEEGIHDRYVLVARRTDVPLRPRKDVESKLKLGVLEARTIFDPKTFLPVACFATTPRDATEMQIPLTSFLQQN